MALCWRRPASAFNLKRFSLKVNRQNKKKRKNMEIITLVKTILSLLCVIVIVLGELLRINEDASDNLMIYRKMSDSQVHPVQFRENKFSYLTLLGGITGISIQISTSYSHVLLCIILSFLFMVGVSIVADLIFQRRINMAFYKVYIYNDEPSYWMDDKGRKIPKIFYGKLRRYQLYIGICLCLISVLVYSLTL